MVREAGLQNAIRKAGFARLADILAVCEDESVLGVPFYVMRYLDGHVITSELPPGLDTPEARNALGLDLVDTLAEIHSADVSRDELAAFARPGSYMERQVRRFKQLWEINKTRDLPQVEQVGSWLAAQSAGSSAGDGRARRLPPREHDGRTRRRPPRIIAVLDWEMGAIGDPRADVGYLLATYTEPNGRVERARLLPGDGRRPASRRARSSWPGTRNAAAAKCNRSRGSKHSHSGRRRCSARRSTGATFAASSAERTRVPRSSSRECRCSPQTALEAIS